jgi:lysophospholipase L1-like esterase
MKAILAAILSVVLSACGGGNVTPLPPCSFDEGLAPPVTWSGSGTKLVFTGDSIMMGFNLALYFPSYQTLNVAIAGQCTTQVNARFDRDVLSNSPDVIVMNGGINDILKGQLSTEYLKESILKAKEAGVRVIVVGTYLPGPEIDHLTNIVAAWTIDMVDFTTSHGIEYIDNTYQGVTSGLLPDGIHLNSYGYMTLANKISLLLTTTPALGEINN